MNTIREQLGIDFDDMGLAEAIDNVTDQIQNDRIWDAIGIAIRDDGGMFEDSDVTPKELLKNIAFNDDKVMQMLELYASRSEEFMGRL